MKTNDRIKNKIERDATRKKHVQSRWYTRELKSLLGNTWAMFYAILGGRMTGKSYALAKFLCNQKRKKGDNVKNYWLRISETSIKLLLANKAENLIDPDLVREYKLNLTTKGMNVYNNGELLVQCMPLSLMGKGKGSALYDKDYRGEYNIVLDEFQLEQGERRTSFDILYNFIGTLETLARTTKKKIRIFLVGNTLEESSSILKAFDFLPEKFGRFYLKRRRCIVDNIEPTEEYLKDRKGSAADILGGDKMSNYTNELKKDLSLISKARLIKPQYKIKFGKTDDSVYIVWNDNIISRWKGQPINTVISMRPYLDERFTPERRNVVIDMFDAKAYKFNNLITLSYFQGELQKLRK